MKKTLLLVLVMIISGVTAACSSQNNTSQAALDSSTPAAYSPSPSASPSASVSPSPSSSASKNTDTAHFEWGDKMETVKAIDTSAAQGTEDNTLESSATISNINMYLQYNFNSDNQLYEQLYISVARHENVQGYIDDFEALKAGITQIFGKPTDDSILKTDDRAEKVDALTALESGYTTYTTTWTSVDLYKPKDTKINLVMTSANKKISLGIIFESIDIPGPK